MKSYKPAVGVFLLATLIGTSAFAADWEITAGTGLSLNVAWPAGGSNTTVLAIDPAAVTTGIGYQFSPGLEVVLDPTIDYTFGTSTSASNFSALILVGLNYSFMPKMNDSMFVEGDVGFALSSTGSLNGLAGGSTTQFAWELAVGKRFALADNISYRPEIQFESVLGSKTATPPTTTSYSVNIVPLMFSFFL